MEQYIKNHSERGEYTSRRACGGTELFVSRRGWEDAAPGAGVIFSHRSTPYTRESFNEGMHSHTYGELILYLGGEVEYIVGDRLFLPRAGDAIFVPPGVMHTARLRQASVYERYVIYHSPPLFELSGRSVPPRGFEFDAGRTEARRFAADARFLARAEAAEDALRSPDGFGTLRARAEIISLFGLLSELRDDKTAPPDALTGTLAEIKKYIDENYASIGSISEVAAHFFYSREHLCRAFKAHFNVSPSEYLVGKRVYASLDLLEHSSVADTCYAVGFGNQTSYIAAFRRIMGCLPSEYKRKRG